MVDAVQFEKQSHLGIITLNRPQALNALTLPMILSLQEQLSAWETDDGIHAVIIRAVPGKAFCAGGDVRWLYEMGKQNDPRQMEFFWHEYQLNHLIHHFKKPYVALMDGITMGGGVGISLHGSHSVASENFLFAMPETSIGFFPDIGASYLLSRCPNKFGVYLGLTGDRLKGEDALMLGLVRHFVPFARFPDLLDELVNTDLSDNAHDKVSDCLNQFSVSETGSTIMKWQASIDQSFNHHSVETIFDELEKGDNQWHQEMLTKLNKKSPLSLKVTLKQLRKAKLMTMTECIKMDYCLVGNFMQGHDFYEGVRVLLVEKDKSPNWNPETLEAISEDQVNEYFNCHGKKLSFS